MSIKVLEGSLEILELLLYLEPTYPITSYEIKQQFASTKEITLLKRLNKLAAQGLVDKRKKDKILPGGDKFEYQLMPKGQEFRTQLMKKVLKIIPPSLYPIQKVRQMRVGEQKEIEEKIQDLLVNITPEITSLLQDFFQDNAPSLLKEQEKTISDLVKSIQRIIQKELNLVL